MRCVRPQWTTGSDGLPVATIARPSDHRIASAAVHSLLLGGFDSGNTIGRSLVAAIARTTPSVNRPAAPDVPMRIVGSKLRMVSSSVMCAGSRHSYVATSSTGRAYAALKSSNSARACVTSPRLSTVQMRRRASSWERISEPEDPFPVGDDDDGRRPRMVFENGIDPVALFI
jgi:hypothetical protein